MGRFCLLVELHREGSAPAACAAGLFSCQVAFNVNEFSTQNICPFDIFSEQLFGQRGRFESQILDLVLIESWSD